MDVTWLGHSCFRIRGKDITIVTDPFAPALGLPLTNLQADVVTISHSHPNHSHVQALSGNPKVLEGPGEYEVSNTYIRAFFTPKEAPSEKNLVFLMQVDGITLCHLGDLSQPLSSTQVEALSRPDVLMAPAGGVCTLSPKEIADAIRLLGPKSVLPMHYASQGIAVQLGPLDAFLKEMGLRDVTPQARLSVSSPSSLPQATQVVVLDRGR